MVSNTNTQTTAAPLPPLAVRLRVAADLLGTSPRGFWQMTRDGVVPHMMLGKVVVYSWADLQRWLAELAKTGGTP